MVNYRVSEPGINIPGINISNYHCNHKIFTNCCIIFNSYEAIRMIWVDMASYDAKCKMLILYVHVMSQEL